MTNFEKCCEELREHNEELQQRIDMLEIAVDHWRHLYKTLDILYQQAVNRG